MNTEKRREILMKRLREAKQPLTGTKLARELGVSRQIIVGDISILRAEGTQIFATPRGYIMPQDAGDKSSPRRRVRRHPHAHPPCARRRGTGRNPHRPQAPGHPCR